MSPKNILVVEDDKALAEAIQIKLKKTGYNVFVARSVPDAIDSYKNHSPIDLVWLDHYLIGRENGLDFLEYLRNDANGKDTPILVVSNTISPELIKAYQTKGANKFFTKSDVKLDELIQEVQQLT